MNFKCDVYLFMHFFVAFSVHRESYKKCINWLYSILWWLNLFSSIRLLFSLKSSCGECLEGCIFQVFSPSLDSWRTTWRSVGSANSFFSAFLGCGKPCAKILGRCQGTWRLLMNKKRKHNRKWRWKPQPETQSSLKSQNIFLNES